MGWSRELLDDILLWWKYYRIKQRRESIKSQFPSMCKTITNAFGEEIKYSLGEAWYKGKRFTIRSHCWNVSASISFNDNVVADYDRFEDGLISFNTGDWCDDFIELHRRALDKDFGDIE